MFSGALPIFLLFGCLLAVGCGLLVAGALLNPRRAGRVKRMPYESGMDPIHDTRRRFDVRFHLLAIAFLVFDVELLFLYPWAVIVRAEASGPTVAAASVPVSAAATAPSVPAAAPGSIAPRPAFLGGIVFIAVLSLGFVYDWKKGVFGWR
jgi:NADH-quinone oxidoreductase subunit A